MGKTIMASPASKASGSPNVKQDLSPFIKKFPAFKTTGNSFTDSKRKTQRQYLQEIVNHLWQHPDMILDAHGLVFSRDFMESKSSSTTDSSSAAAWPDKCSCVAKIPKKWMASFILDRAGIERAQLTSAMITAMEKASPENIPQCFEFLTQIPAKLVFPDSMQSCGTVAAKVFHSRATACGFRLKHLVEKGAFASNGQIDWSKAAFSCQWKGEELASVKYWSGAEGTIPECVRITKKFTLAFNYSDAQACFEAPGMPPMKISAWFPAGAAPNNDKISDKRAKVLASLADEASQAMDRAAQAHNAGDVVVHEGLLDEAAEERQAASTAKARARLAEAAEKRKALRRVVFE